MRDLAIWQAAALSFLEHHPQLYGKIREKLQEPW
jgi:hypothetical protein